MIMNARDRELRDTDGRLIIECVMRHTCKHLLLKLNLYCNYMYIALVVEFSWKLGLS